MQAAHARRMMVVVALVSSQVAGRGGNEGHKAEEIAMGSPRVGAGDPRGRKAGRKAGRG